MQRSGPVIALAAAVVIVLLVVIARAPSSSGGAAAAGSETLPAAWATTTTPPAPGESIVMPVASATARVDMPTGTPLGIAAVFAPNDGIEAFMDSAPVAALRDAGWIVATADVTGEVPNEALAIQQFYRFLAWVTEVTGVPVRLHFSTGSGSEVSLSAIAYADLAVPCWFAIDPQVDLARTALYAPGAGDPSTGADFLPPDTRYYIVSLDERPSTPAHLSARRLVAELQSSERDVTVSDARGLDDDDRALVGRELAREAAECAA